MHEQVEAALRYAYFDNAERMRQAHARLSQVRCRRLISRDEYHRTLAELRLYRAADDHAKGTYFRTGNCGEQRGQFVDADGRGIDLFVDKAEWQGKYHYVDPTSPTAETVRVRWGGRWRRPRILRKGTVLYRERPGSPLLSRREPTFTQPTKAQSWFDGKSPFNENWPDTWFLESLDYEEEILLRETHYGQEWRDPRVIYTLLVACEHMQTFPGVFHGHEMKSFDGLRGYLSLIGCWCERD